jgi:DNA polymerase I-like protein with 3'-5' exonuclease and polymerase domains
LNITFISSEDSFYKTIEPLLKLKSGDNVPIDLETENLDCFSGRIITLQIVVNSNVYIYDVRRLKKNLLQYLMGLLENKLLIGHNIKFDLKFIKRNYEVDLKNVYDTMLVETVLNAGIGLMNKKTGREVHRAFYSLKDLVEKYVPGETLNKETRDVFKDNYEVNLTPEVLDYCAKDVIYLNEIKEKQLKCGEERKVIKVINLENRLLPAVVDMEYNGVLIDKVAWLKLADEASKKLLEYKDQVYKTIISDLKTKLQERKSSTNAMKVLDHYKVSYKKTKKVKAYMESVTDSNDIIREFGDNFNPSSHVQMLRVLHSLGVDSKSTSSKELELNFKHHPFVKILLEFRKWEKKVTSFGENFLKDINPVTGKIHSEFHQGGAATGRFASLNPDLQNIPIEDSYRYCFIAPDGYDVISADYSQIELVTAAELSQDKTMIAALKRGDNIHALTASKMYKLDTIKKEEIDPQKYTNGKSMNFAMIYGSTAKGLSYNFQVPLEEANEYMEIFSNTYPGLVNFMKAVHREILKRGYSITPFGRRRWFILPTRWNESDYKYLYQIYREGFNHVIQGCSADMTKISMANIYHNNPFGVLLKLIMTIHDEIVLIAHKSISREAAEFVRSEMISAGKLFIKTLDVSVGIKIEPHWVK